MPKPTRSQLHSFRLFQQRQTRYEKTYEKLFFAFLRKTYNEAARQYRDNGQLGEYIDHRQLEKIFRRLYTTITIKEATIAYNEVVRPLSETAVKVSGVELEKKDIINDLIDILNPSERGIINVWRSLLDNFLQVRLTNRITMINQTTEERIRKLIEDGIFEGYGQEQVAKKIREEAGGNINVHRSRNIARTETLVSSSQGKFMAAQSSNLQMVKKWHPATDARTRLSHRAMLDNDWIDLEKDFWVANDLGVLEPALFPGDERLSASNVCNCRCGLVFQPKRNENGELIRKR